MGLIVVRLHPDAAWRSSKRGVVLSAPQAATVLFEHPRADELLDCLADDPPAGLLQERLRERLGPPLQADLVEVLLEERVLVDGDGPDPPPRERAIRFTRSGVLFPGIATPSRWLDRRLVPALLSLPGRLLVLLVVAAGTAAFVVGRPDLPPVSQHPALEGLLGLTLGLLLTVFHELAHGVALVHYGRTPTRAGFGFYWGALSFYVDSTPVLTLGRRQRVIQALVGLAVDLVTLSVCAVLAHVVDSEILAIVFWRVAVLSLIEVAVNAAPVLEVDGHWALADLLDEPDLSSRSRSALGQLLRGRWRGERWLPAYGALSLVTGVGLLVVLLAVFWQTTGELVIALFQGNLGDIAIGLYYVVPLLLGVAASTIGLVLETFVQDGSQPDP